MMLDAMKALLPSALGRVCMAVDAKRRASSLLAAIRVCRCNVHVQCACACGPHGLRGTRNMQKGKHCK
jgi:hypothetical protein